MPGTATDEVAEVSKFVNRGPHPHGLGRAAGPGELTRWPNRLRGASRQGAAPAAGCLRAVPQGACQRERASQECDTQFGCRRADARDECGRDGCPDTHREARKERRSPRCRRLQTVDRASDWKGTGWEKSDHMFGHEGNIEHPPDGEQVF